MFLTLAVTHPIPPNHAVAFVIQDNLLGFNNYVEDWAEKDACI